jgi:hypothetical protein
MRLNLQGDVNMNDAERKEFLTNGKAPTSDASKEEISHKEDISTYLLEVRHCHCLIYVATINFTTSCMVTV